MQKYQRLFSLIVLSLALGACSFIPVYRPSIEQGNLLSQDKVEQLAPGMTREEVKSLLGTPMLQNALNANRWDYVYTFKPGDGSTPKIEKRLTLYFVGDRLDHIGGTSYPQPKGKANLPVPVADEPHPLSLREKEEAKHVYDKANGNY